LRDLRTLKKWRDAGIVRASWHEDGELASVEFAPQPAAPPAEREAPAKRPEEPKRTASAVLRELSRKPWLPSEHPEAV
jgi:hypothetical protein